MLARAHGRRGLAPLCDLLAYDPAPVTHTRSELERLFLDLQLTGEQEWVIGAVRSLLDRAASTANL